LRYRTNPISFKALIKRKFSINNKKQVTMNNQPVRPQQQPQQQQQPQAAGVNNLQLQAILQAIFGPNGQNIVALTQQIQAQQQPAPRELTLVESNHSMGKTKRTHMNGSNCSIKQPQ